MTTSSNADIELTPGGTGNINVPAGVGLTFGSQTTDISMGRNTEDPDEWIFFETPTPGSVNNN